MVFGPTTTATAGAGGEGNPVKNPVKKVVFFIGQMKRWAADKTGIHLRLQNILLPLVPIQNCQTVSIYKKRLF